MRLLHLEPNRVDPILRTMLGEHCEVDYVECESQEHFLGLLRKKPYEALFTRLGLHVGQDALAANPALRFVLSPTTGLNHVDVELLHAAAIRIVSLKGEVEFLRSIHSTAEHTWALLLALVRQVTAAHADVLAGHWRRERFFSDELDGATLGILGLGRLGSRVAHYGAAFGMTVIAHDVADASFERNPGVTRVTKKEVFEKSDFVSVHLPYAPDTERSIGKAEFRAMKKNAYFVNTARGEIVDESALLDALESHQIAGAALDVLDGDSTWSERDAASHPLVLHAREKPNLILTPHVGGCGKQSTLRTRHFVAQKFLELAFGSQGVP